MGRRLMSQTTEAIQAPELPRWVALTAPVGDALFGERLTWFGRFVFLHLAARTFLTSPGPLLGDLATAVKWTTIAVALAGLVLPRFSLAITRIACVLVLVYIPSYLPDSANHVFLELLFLAFLSFLDERDEEEGVLLCSALRWLVAVVFLWTGVQKLLYGYYFDGQFLAYMAATKTWFGDVFRYLIPAEELQRLVAFNEPAASGTVVFTPRIGAGPYSVHSALFVAVSNAVYVFEIVVGLLLLVPRTRVLAALASILFVVFIELGARELTFGFLITNAFMLYLPGNWVRRTFPLWAVAYGYLVLAKLFPTVFVMFKYSAA